MNSCMPYQIGASYASGNRAFAGRCDNFRLAETHFCSQNGSLPGLIVRRAEKLRFEIR